MPGVQSPLSRIIQKNPPYNRNIALFQLPTSKIKPRQNQNKENISLNQGNRYTSYKSLTSGNNIIMLLIFYFWLAACQIKVRSRQINSQNKTQIDSRVLESVASARKRSGKSTVHITVPCPDSVGSERPGFI